MREGPAVGLPGVAAAPNDGADPSSPGKTTAMLTWNTGDRDAQRRALRLLPNSRFISPDEYTRLLVSRQRFERADDLRAGVRGLRDRVTGALFLVEEEALRMVGA
jgi:hypothetical protein